MIQNRVFGGGSLLVSRRSRSIGVIYLIDVLRADLRVDTV